MTKKCQNCHLHDEENGVCRVTVLLEGQRYSLPVKPWDECHWEKLNEEMNSEIEHRMASEKHPYTKSKLAEELEKNLEVHQVRVWSDGENGYIETDEEEK